MSAGPRFTQLIVATLLALAVSLSAACLGSPPPDPTTTEAITQPPTSIQPGQPTQPQTLSPTAGMVVIPTATPYPTPAPTLTPATPLGLYDTQNARWLSENYPALYRQLQQLPWVRDGLSDDERGTIDELLFIGATDIANLKFVLRLPWVQDAISKTEHEAIYWLQALGAGDAEFVAEVIAMPFLVSVETSDVLAIRGLHKLASNGLLRTLAPHPTVLDGITDDETTLIAATGTFREAEDVRRLLEPEYASIETVSSSTKMTPSLRISIVRTGTQFKPGTAFAVRDAVEFVEQSMRLPLPVDHVIVVLDEEAVVESFAGTNYGFAVSYVPKYEHSWSTPEWYRLQVGLVHEVAHYYWGGNKDWIDEGMADIIEYQYGAQNGLSRGQLKNRRGDCEAHDLAMLSEWNPPKSDQQFRCNYFLGWMLFQAMLESMGTGAFSTKMGELYQLSLVSTIGVDAVRLVFSHQLDIIALHWSGGMNAPENRPFNEGKERPTHDLIQWDQYPTYDGRSVSFQGTLLGDAVLSKANIHQARGGGKYPNFGISHVDNPEYVGTILPQLVGGSNWTLDDPGDSVATTYRLSDGGFDVRFPFPKALGDPSGYVITVWGFQDNSRNPTIGEHVDVVSYARIRDQTP